MKNQVMVRSSVPRGLRYNGEARITRVVTFSLGVNPSGILIGIIPTTAINIVFDPTAITCYSSAANFSSFPIPNAAEYIAMYDRLKIDKIDMTWSTQAQASTSTATGAAAPPKWLVCTDENDGIGTASLTQVQQQNPKSFFAVDGRDFKYSLKPKYQRIVYQTSTVSNYEPATGFVNSDSTIPHYGVRMAIANLTNVSPTTGVVDFSFKVYLSLKNTK